MTGTRETTGGRGGAWLTRAREVAQVPRDQDISQNLHVSCSPGQQQLPSVLGGCAPRRRRTVCRSRRN